MIPLDCTFDTVTGPRPLGLIVLQADETLEPEFRRLLPGFANPIYTSRIPSHPTVTPENLASMAPDLTRAASLLPDLVFAAVGYACTSASAVIGSDAVDTLVQKGCRTGLVTNPIRAVAAQAGRLGVSRFAMVSPYVEEVNTPLRAAFAQEGLCMDVFGSFGISAESEVARISTRSVIDAALRIGRDPTVEAVFLSCTNLRTVDALPEIADRLGKPALSSNAALAWHLRHVADSLAAVEGIVQDGSN